MKLDLKNLDELIAASTRNNNNVNEILYKNSEELAKYFQIHVGTNLTITDLEGLLSPKESELSTLKNTAIKPTILEQLGVNVWDSSRSGSNGIKSPNLSDLSFQYANEGENIEVDFNVVDTLTYSNNRVSGVIELEKVDHINKTPEQINEWLLIEIKQAIHTAIFKQLVTKLQSLTAVSGYTSSDSAKTYSITDFNNLEAANGGEYSNFSYLFSPSVARKLKVTDNGFSEPILKNRLVNDVQSIVRNEVSNTDVILGDFSKIGVMIHGLNIFFDPYTMSDNGKLLCHVISKLDVHILRENSFSIGQNFSS